MQIKMRVPKNPIKIIDSAAGYRYTIIVPTIHCRNQRAESGQEIKECHRVLLRVSEGVVDFIRANPGESILVRCPACPQYLRWIEVANVEGRLTFQPVDQPDLDAELDFDHILAGEIVA